MSNNCLVTKLKSVVDNDNLTKIGEIRFDIKEYVGEGTRTGLMLVITPMNGNYVKVEALDGGYIEDLSIQEPTPIQVIEKNVRMWISIPNQPDFRLSITGKYDLGEILFSQSQWGSEGQERTMNTSIEQFEYMTNCYDFMMQVDLKGDATKIFTETPTFSRFYMRSYTIDATDLTIDLDNLPIAACADKLTYCVMMWSAGIRGNLSYFAPFTKLTEMNLTATNIYGTIESLADAMSVNRKSGTLSITNQYGKITYQGTRKDSWIITFTENGYTVE